MPISSADKGRPAPDAYGHSAYGHRLCVQEHIKFRLGVLVFRCHNNTVPVNLSNDLQWATDNDTRRPTSSVWLITQADSVYFPSQ